MCICSYTYMNIRIYSTLQGKTVISVNFISINISKPPSFTYYLIKMEITLTRVSLHSIEYSEYKLKEVRINCFYAIRFFSASLFPWNPRKTVYPVGTGCTGCVSG